MSSKQETLFVLELVVDFVRLEESHATNFEIALGIRFLDFPTLIIYQSGREDHHSSYADLCPSSEAQAEDRDDFKYTFHKGKSCLFKINLETFHSYLLSTPLYAVVMDVTAEIPKLKGSSLISLAKATERIRENVNLHGINTPVAHGEKLLSPIYSLMGQCIGAVSLAYKIVSLGAHLIPHISDQRVHEVGVAPTDQRLQDAQWGQVHIELPPKSPENQKMIPQQIGVDGGSAAGVVSEANKPRVIDYDELNSSLYPPPLFYCASDKNRQEKKCFSRPLIALERVLVNKEPEDNGENEKEELFPDVDGPGKITSTPKLENKETVSAPLVNAIRQLPLLNALLLELAQLNLHTRDPETLSAHPQLSCLYSSGQEAPLTDTKLDLVQKDRARERSEHMKIGLKQTPAHSDIKTGLKSVMHAKKTLQPKGNLKYGLTNTFRLRLKLVQKSPPKKQHGTRDLSKRQRSHDQKQLWKPKSQGFPFDEEVEGSEINKTLVEPSGVSTAGVQMSHGKIYEQNKSNLIACQYKKIDSSSSSPQESKLNDPGFRENSTEDQSGQFDAQSNASFLQDDDYRDDFTSLNTTDGFSPEPISSPDPNLRKTNSRCSSSNASHKNKRIPIPAKADNSPQRSLKSTHVIRPRLQMSALSVSSDEEESLSSGRFGDCRGFVGKTSSIGSSLSSSKKSLKLDKESLASTQSMLMKSVSSSEHLFGEGELDNLDSLELDKKYNHISEMVINKLPGYTL